MKLFRFMLKGKEHYGVLEDVELRLIEGDVFGEWRKTEKKVKLWEAGLMAPVSPSKVVALGLNYRDHAREMGMKIPEEPILFLKPSTSVIGPNDPILYPAGDITKRVDYEAELGIVIGKRCRDVKAAEAHDVILGYTCVNDVTARDLQAKDGQWTRAKSFDTFCPIGPCIETELDTANRKVQAVLNGKVVQDSSTQELVFDVPHIVEEVSRVMTLLPGDVIATGTPPGVGPMKPGDTITIHVEGIGRLTNPVKPVRPPEEND
ncbi:MAG TPA: fumarylacetoacetate hydrolase family protein [bacterium]|nr:fumarylacetoacetate hydrolase family protein [bacterium]